MLVNKRQSFQGENFTPMAEVKLNLMLMSKTNEGKKKVHVPAHTKKVGGKKIKVREHYRSTPN